MEEPIKEKEKRTYLKKSDKGMR